MKQKAVILLLGTVLAVSGAVFKGSQNANANLPETSAMEANQTSISPKLKNLEIIAQSGDSPWNQRISTKTYTNPDTRQELCFYYNSSRWAPCPGQGDQIIIPQNAKCRGGNVDDIMNPCPAARCFIDNLTSTSSQIISGGSGSSVPPCTGLP